MQLDLFETANIKLEVPYRYNQKNWKPRFVAYSKACKRIETVFSQFADQFMIKRNYAKKVSVYLRKLLLKYPPLQYCSMQITLQINH